MAPLMAPLPKWNAPESSCSPNGLQGRETGRAGDTGRGEFGGKRLRAGTRHARRGAHRCSKKEWGRKSQKLNRGSTRPTATLLRSWPWIPSKRMAAIWMPVFTAPPMVEAMYPFGSGFRLL